MAVAIVLAAGNGSRMSSDIPKQFLKIKEKEVLYYSLKTFQEHEKISEIILVTRKEDIDFCENQIVKKYGFDKVKKICEGGKERYDSVYRGLCMMELLDEQEKEIVMIHDGARPFVTDQMISDSLHAMESSDACTVSVPVKDTIKVVEERNGVKVGVETPDRNTLYQIQTPQTFHYEVLRSAYEKLFQDENHNITDDTMLVEQYEGRYSVIVSGSYENIKITTPEDLEIADKFVEKIWKNS